MTDHPEKLVVTAGNGGLGLALLQRLLEAFPGAEFDASYHRERPALAHPRLRWQQLDLRDPAAIETWSDRFDRVDWLINCAGYLHGEAGGPEKSVRAIEADFVLDNIRINTLPTLLLAKHFSAAFKRSPAPLLATISARVGSIEDNRLGGWYSYRLSKAALNMALKTLSIEWRHSHPRGCVAALHPGTNDTALSKPFQANVPPQDLMQPSDTANQFVQLLARLGPEQSGRFWAWDGTELPW